MDFPTNHQQTIISTRRFRFKRNVIAIHLVYRPGYLFNDHNPHRTIWGFYDTKKQQFRSYQLQKVGKVVDIRDTTPFTAMQLNLEHLNPLELAFVL